MNKVISRLFFALALIVSALPAQAQLIAGQDYRAIEPALPTEDPTKIEVVEFFNYGCPHCNDMHPTLSKWVAKLPGDVAFRRQAVGFGDPYYTTLARLYFALEITKNLDRLDSAVFHAIHEKGLKLTSEAAVIDWVGLQGADAVAVGGAFRSFGVKVKVDQANQNMQAARIRGVPAIIVDGRYLMLNNGISHAQVLANTNKVIDLVRKERNLSKKK